MNSDNNTSLLATLPRVFWIMIGPMVLAVLAFLIVDEGGGWLTGKDIAFLVVLAAVIIVRWLEFQIGNPLTAAGEPANAADLRRFALRTLLTGLGVWAAANVIGNHLLGR